MGINNTGTGKPLGSRPPARERAQERTARFYGPAIVSDVDAAVDYALQETGGSPQFRSVWCFYCLRLGINTFLDQLESVLACARQNELRDPARAFHARIRRMKDQIDRSRAVDVLRPKGGAK